MVETNKGETEYDKYINNKKKLMIVTATAIK